MIICSQCKYHFINFQKVIECTKFSSLSDNSEQAKEIRIFHAKALNRYLNCLHFKKLSFVDKIKKYLE